MLAKVRATTEPSTFLPRHEMSDKSDLQRILDDLKKSREALNKAVSESDSTATRSIVQKLREMRERMEAIEKARRDKDPDPKV